LLLCSCRDFDLCDACATKDYAESLGLLPPSGVVFTCPYGCGVVGLTEPNLRSHITVSHVEDPRVVNCPVCVANNDGQAIDPAFSRYQQPNFLVHLERDHGNSHDPRTHVLITCPKTVLHILHRRTFNPVAAFDMKEVPYQKPAKVVSTPAAAAASSSSSRAEVLAPMHLYRPPPSESSLTPFLGLPFGIPPVAVDHSYVEECARVQRTVAHEGTVCSRCRVKDIRGVVFRCCQCADYSLCPDCHAQPYTGYSAHGSDDHPAWHTYLVFRRPLVTNGPIDQLPMNNQYPGALTGDSPCPTAGPVNLHTEWFFLTMHSLHVGLTRTLQRYTSLAQNLDSETDPRKIEALLKVRLCADAQLMQPELLVDTLRLYVLMATWMRTLIDPSNSGPPLAPQIPMEYASLPEYFIEDAADFLLFLSRFALETFEQVDCKPVLHLFTLLLSSKDYLLNPYLRAKLVETFCSLADNADNPLATFHKQPPKNDLQVVLSACPFLLTHFIPALVRLYVEIEHTGNDSQFYTKFNVRHSIAVMLKWLSAYPAYLAVLEKEAARDPEMFVRFANSVINDMIYLLDEALIKANMLATAQAEAAVPLGQRRENQERQALFARGLRTASVLAVHTVQLLALLTAQPQTRSILTRPEMLDRIVQFINQYITKVCNAARRQSITVSDPMSLSFKPDEWLQIFLFKIYLPMATNAGAASSSSTGEDPLNSEFIKAVARDSASFVGEDLLEARAVLEKAAVGGEDAVLRQLDVLIAAAIEQSKSASSHAAALGDIPEDFLDPILSTLMHDPVTLPSGVTLDRAVITRHLLNNLTDPFNRAPLTLAQVVPNTELKARIQAWLATQQS
jgi:hypothetical protein